MEPPPTEPPPNEPPPNERCGDGDGENCGITRGCGDGDGEGVNCGRDWNDGVNDGCAWECCCCAWYDCVGCA